MDVNALASQWGIDTADVKEIVALFITTTLSDIHKIKKSVALGNSADAAAQSHSIKGAAGNLGFDDIFILTGKMELQARQGCLDQFNAYIRELETKVNGIRI